MKRRPESTQSRAVTTALLFFASLLFTNWRILGREDLNQLPVMANGRLAGVLSRAHVLDYLRTRAELRA